MRWSKLLIVIFISAVFAAIALLVSCSLASSNSPPAAPSNPSPADGATNVDVTADLSWACSDPDGDTLWYNIYLGTEEGNLREISSYITEASITLGPLRYGTTYYWRIIAIDSGDDSTMGEVWSFTTEDYMGTGPYLWCMGIDDSISKESICRIDPENGGVIDFVTVTPVGSAASPGILDGLAWDGTNPWYCSNYNDEIYCINQDDGSRIHTFDSPGTSPAGLTWDGTSLWNVDTDTDEIYEINPSDGTVISTIDAPCSDPDGLTWDGTTLWCTGTSPNSELYQVDPSNGDVLGTYTISDSSDNGLTFDGTFFWGSDATNYYSRIQKLNANGVEVSSIDAPEMADSDIDGLAWEPASK